MRNWKTKDTSQHYMSSTMNAHEPSRNPSAKNKRTSKSLRPTTMQSMPVNPPSSQPSTMPLPSWQPSTQIAQFNFGASLFLKWRSLSTSYGPQGWVQRSQHARRSMARNSTGIEHPSHHLGQGHSASYLPRSGTLSNPMLSIRGMSAHQCSTTTKCTSIIQRRDTTRAAGRINCFRRTLACHQSPKTTTQS